MTSQRQSRNGGRSCETIASFLLKTYQILDHPQFQHIITWDRDNIGFIVKDVVAFTKQILPKYFRHSNFSSFVRQLNMYDFHKVKQENDNLVFKNPLFRKGQQPQLREIRRKASKRPFTNPRPSFHRQKNNSETQKYINTLKILKKSIEGQINQSYNIFEQSLQLLDENNISNEVKVKYIKQLTQPKLNLESLLKLKEQCYRYFSKIQNWLQQTYQTNSKKLKLTTSFIQQLKKKQQQPSLDKNKSNIFKTEQI